MDLKKTLAEIDKGRTPIEYGFVMSCWLQPELYEEYKEVKDSMLHTKDGKFFWLLGQKLYQQGARVFDSLTIETYLDDHPNIRKKWDSYGGMATLEEMQINVHPDNVSAYFDKIAQKNALCAIASKAEDMFKDVSVYDNYTSEDVYDAWEGINSEISITVGLNEKLDNLVIDDEYIKKLEAGENVGYSYGRYSPLMNWITLGCLPGSLFMIGAGSGMGKSSFAFENIIMSLHTQPNVGRLAVISNEMRVEKFKSLLLIHILTKDMKYFGLTRKQIEVGKYTDEQKEKIKEAQKISEEKYSDVIFIKLFDNNISKIIKYLKKLKTMGCSVVLYDTFKADDSLGDRSIWESLLIDSRKLFQEASRLNMCIVTTYQLALHMMNSRYLDAGSLSNGKQIKEVYESMTYLRRLWSDEYSGEKYDVKPWRWQKDADGKNVKDENGKYVKEDIILDPNETYMLFFIDKTRSDEDKQILIYRWRARFNEFKELGFASVVNNHSWG